MSRSIVILLAAIPLIASCSVYRAYDGSSRPSQSIAVIEVSNAMASRANILYVDGKFRGIGFFSQYEFLPGEHELRVGLNDPAYEGQEITTYFVAEAGKTYTIEGILDGEKIKGYFGQDVVIPSRWYVLIREKGSNRVVNYPRR